MSYVDIIAKHQTVNKSIKQLIKQARKYAINQFIK